MTVAARRLVRDTRGASMAEYLVLGAMAVFLVLAGFRAFGASVDQKVDCQSRNIETLSKGACADGDTPGPARRASRSGGPTSSGTPAAAPAGTATTGSGSSALAALVCVGLVCAMPPPPSNDAPSADEAKVIRERGDRFYTDHGAKPGSCPQCHGAPKGAPGGRSRREWQDAVLDKIGVTRNDLKGYDRFTLPNQAIMKKIYGYYRSVFEQNGDMLWAGMAVLAGHTVWKGLSDNVGMRGFIPSAHTDRIAKELEYHLMRMNLAIFIDLAWMHEAYLAKGLPELEERFKAGEIDQPTIEAWRLIDKGIKNKSDADIQKGNEMLLRREQEVILPPGYENIKGIPGINFGRTMGRMAVSPVPGGRRFSDVVPGGNLARFQDRWKWISSEMVPNWNNMSREDRLHYVELPITNQLTPPFRLDRLGGLGGKGEMDDKTRKTLLELLEQQEKKKAKTTKEKR